ncbi:glycosyltransferase family 2 protein [Mycolicibacterium chubuense]|uniref:glycosyltransferase family 2 protein n=1 Tax=Mycolicibacterium chubuense TaxID=1800 RepID=UPI0013014B69|nr:glycosyltransferase family 2 protein [Mycolicibacterium chubuense]
MLCVHFNTPDITLRLVEGFPRRTQAGREIVIRVLDNCSTGENFATLKQGLDGLPGVILERSTVNLGFGKGINLLAKSNAILDDDIIWIVNPDTRLTLNCLDILETELDLDTFAIISPLIYSGDEADPWIWYCGGSLDVDALRVQHDYYGRALAEAPRSAFETEFVTGAAPMMRASTFRGIGGFPPEYFLYWEDTRLSWEARKLGYKLGVVPSAALWHAVGASSGASQSGTFYYWFARNRFRFAADIGVTRRQLAFGRGAYESLRVVAKALKEREGRLSKLRAAVRGTLAGLDDNA